MCMYIYVYKYIYTYIYRYILYTYTYENSREKMAKIEILMKRAGSPVTVAKREYDS